MSKIPKWFEPYKKDIETLKSDVAQLKTDVAKLKTDVAQLKTDVAQLKTDVAQLKTDVAQLKADVAEIKDALTKEPEWFKSFRLKQEAFNEKIEAKVNAIMQCPTIKRELVEIGYNN